MGFFIQFILLATVVAKEAGSNIVRKTVPQCNLRQHRSSLTVPHFNMADVALLYSEDKKRPQKKRRG